MSNKINIHYKTIEHIKHSISEIDIRHLIVLLIEKGIITIDEFYDLPHKDVGED